MKHGLFIFMIALYSIQTFQFCSVRGILNVVYVIKLISIVTKSLSNYIKKRPTWSAITSDV